VVVGVVSVVVVGVVVVVVEDEVLVVVVGVLVLVVDELVLVVVLEVGVVVVVVCRQSLAASTPTVDAPWVRFRRRFLFTVPGRLLTELLNRCEALDAAPQSPALAADPTWSSWFDSEFAWSAESRPAPPPQAASSETAKPVPHATSARGKNRIRAVTLVAPSAGFG
jgi:hypothetical protein